jgi:hypothetical protein
LALTAWISKETSPETKVHAFLRADYLEFALNAQAFDGLLDKSVPVGNSFAEPSPGILL